MAERSFAEEMKKEGLDAASRTQTVEGPVEEFATPLNTAESLQRSMGNSYLQRSAGGQAANTAGNALPFKTQGASGGRKNLTLDVTFSVTDTPAKSLQVIQAFWGTRRIDNKQVGTYMFKENGKDYDAFVDGGQNSPYVTEGGNAPADPTNPYYLTADEVAKQVVFNKDHGSVRIYDSPGAVALHDEAYFETAVVAVDHMGSGKDKVLSAFEWGWTGKGTSATVDKGTDIAGKPSGLNVKSGISARFTNIVKNDYPRYSYT